MPTSERSVPRRVIVLSAIIYITMPAEYGVVRCMAL